MTRLEWREVAKRIIAKWPHQPQPPESIAESWDAVKDLDSDAVMVAVESFYRAGREWPPTGGMLRERVMELALDAPDWGDVWRWLERYERTGATHPIYGGFESYRAAAERVLERMPAAVAAFITATGDRQLWDALGQEGGGEARMREKWLAWSRRQSREAALFGLPSGGLRALERVNSAAPVAFASILAGVVPELVEGGGTES